MSESRDITSSVTFGLVFIALGSMAILNELGVINVSWRHVLPLILIVAGLAVIISTQVRSRT